MGVLCLVPDHSPALLCLFVRETHAEASAARLRGKAPRRSEGGACRPRPFSTQSLAPTSRHIVHVVAKRSYPAPETPSLAAPDGIFRNSAADALRMTRNLSSVGVDG